MALKFKIKSKDEVPAEQQSLYVERDGVWSLDVEGAVEKAKLDEFRTNNVALAKERDELKKRYEGIDPDEVRKLADEKRRLADLFRVDALETLLQIIALLEQRDIAGAKLIELRLLHRAFHIKTTRRRARRKAIDARRELRPLI